MRKSSLLTEHPIFDISISDDCYYFELIDILKPKNEHNWLCVSHSVRVYVLAPNVGDTNSGAHAWSICTHNQQN